VSTATTAGSVLPCLVSDLVCTMIWSSCQIFFRYIVRFQQQISVAVWEVIEAQKWHNADYTHSHSRAEGSAITTRRKIDATIEYLESGPLTTNCALLTCHAAQLAALASLPSCPICSWSNWRMVKLITGKWRPAIRGWTCTCEKSSAPRRMGRNSGGWKKFSSGETR